MENDLEGKTLEELRELERRLAREIDVMDGIRVHQIDRAVNAAGDEAKDLNSERRIAIHSNINPSFLPSLDDLHNRLRACQKRIDRLTQN